MSSIWHPFVWNFKTSYSELLQTMTHTWNAETYRKAGRIKKKKPSHKEILFGKNWETTYDLTCMGKDKDKGRKKIEEL